MENNIDTDLYSRQIGTFGMDIMGKLLKLKVLIVGMRGLGVEVAKNIILSGAHLVHIHDSSIAKINDLGSNFYLSSDDVGKKPRDEACLKNLSSLNPSTQISVLKLNSGKYSAEYIKEFCNIIPNYDIIVFTEIQPKNFLIEINEECRKKNVKMIYGTCLGLVCGIFVDFGNHVIIDEKGRESKSYYVKYITKDEEGLVSIDNISNTEKLDLGDGNYVKFQGVEGMVEVNDKEFQIYVENMTAFRIGDTSKFGNYEKGGIVYEIKKPKNVIFDDYKTRSEIIRGDKSTYYYTDFTKIGRDVIYFITLGVLQEFFEKNNFSLPELNNMEIAKNIMEQVRNKYENIKKNKNNLQCYQNMIEFNEKIVLNTIRWSAAHICPVTAFFGGIIAQEIIKSTGQYAPINQWLFFDFFETIENINEDVDRKLKNSRYDDQIAIFGNKIQEKIQKSNFFMVGAGATGCEFLKNFAMMGACSAKNNKFMVTDNDNIEVSNLSRQFLFKKNDVGKSKSEVAKNAVKLMNPECNVESMQDKVCPETENIFNEDFWQNNDFLIYAVDSIEARKYIDTKAITFEKCAIDSGTSGVEGRTQIIVPHETDTYNDEVPHSVIKEIPSCTLRLFPSKIEHCIEYARNCFFDYFFFLISDTKKFFIDKQNFIETYKGTGNIEKLESIKNIIDLIVSKNIEKFVEYAMNIYINRFDYNIRSILISFPEDYKSKNGKPFWCSSKIRPHEIPFNPNDELCIKYIQVIIHILSHALGLQFSKDELSSENIKKICYKIKLPEFKAEDINVEIDGNMEGANQSSESEEEKIRKMNEENEKKKLNILKELENIDITKFDKNKINSEKFEKDHDDNGHIDFIHLTATFRARNYNLKECDRSKTKIISGNILPTILTSTASVAGIASLQVFTLMHTHKRNYLRKCFFNLGRTEFIIGLPNKPIYKKDKKLDKDLKTPVKVIPENCSIWSKIEIKGSKTCSEIIEYLKEKYGIEVDILVSGEVSIINTILPSAQKYVNRKPEDIYNEKSKIKLDKNYMMINVIAYIQNVEIEGEKIESASVYMPLIKYIFK